MRADERFLRLPKTFWANVRTISQALGYQDRKTKQVRAYTIEDMLKAMKKVGLGSNHLVNAAGPTLLAQQLESYFAFRAAELHNFVEPRLMNADQARPLFQELSERYKPRCRIPSNKQKGEKAGPAFLTGMVNIIVEAFSEGAPVNYDPQSLTTVTHDDAPLRTLARRVDGAFPGTVNPIAIWEIKEYYFTTTFGSRIADGVYETLLDGMELEELAEASGIDVEHVLIVDSHFNWWGRGRSYLCRLIDMLHMGYVDEVLFGREVVERLPALVQSWVEEFRKR